MLFFVTYSSQRHNLNSIKDKTVGNGQHGTARWATQQEIKRIYHHVPFTPELWRQAAREGKQPTANGKSLPQGIVLGSKGNRTTTALVDSDDIHVMMIGASGVGKTAYFLYPNLEYACASGMSFLALDTKGDLARNYGAIASEIMCDNCQDTIFGGFAPNSQTANTLSGNLGSRTVLSGTVTKGKNDDSQSLQMMERPLMSPDELKSMPKGSFVVMKTGTHPMKTKLKLFFEWGIQFQKPLEMPDRGSRPVYYAGKQDLERSILSQFPMIHMPMGAAMPPRVQTASKPMPAQININTEDE